MDITIPNLKPGKHRLTLKYSDPFSDTNSSFSRALFIETPKAPPLISEARFAPVVTKRVVKKSVTRTYTDTVRYRRRKKNVVTLWTTASHGLKKGNKISLTGMAVANLNTSSGKTHTITTVTNSKIIKFNKKGSDFNKTLDPGTISLSQTLTVPDYFVIKIYLPENVKKSLEWTSTLRDVVFFLWEENDGSGDLKYLTSNLSDPELNGLSTDFTSTPPAYPSGLTKKRANAETRIESGNYKFRYVIVRYYKNSSGSWIGYFPMLLNESIRATTDDIIVSSAGVI
jgi:hypothetical protein